jgi:hypothetical protein
MFKVNKSKTKRKHIMKKLMLTLAILTAGIAQAAVPKTGTLAIPSNTTSAVTSVAIGDAYNYQREVDSVKLTVTGHTDTNVALIATLGQPFGAITNTMGSASFTANGVSVVFPRQVFFTNGVERFYTETVSLSCAFALATNTSISATLTNASAISISIVPK